jgi:hypothetical protein
MQVTMTVKQLFRTLKQLFTTVKQLFTTVKQLFTTVKQLFSTVKQLFTRIKEFFAPFLCYTLPTINENRPAFLKAKIFQNKFWRNEPFKPFFPFLSSKSQRVEYLQDCYL